MRPILVISKQRVGHATSVGPIAHLVRLKCYEKEIDNLHGELGGTHRPYQLDRNVMKGNREFAIHLSVTEIPIGETEVIRVCGSGYVK